MVTDHIKKTKTITHYDYDAFGRRTLVQDEGGKIIRTLYDGLSFDIIREQETFADGYFTNTNDTGIAWGAVTEGDGSRYRYIGDDASAAKEQNGYSVTASNRVSSRVALYAKGKAISQTRSSNNASTERTYFGTDLLGTVRSATRDSGTAQYYDYDVFGKPLGDNISDFAYTGKPYDPTTGMYNYGYRDYSPQTARFTTVDPIRDGSNWFVYCNNEPVNWVDEWGLRPLTQAERDLHAAAAAAVAAGTGAGPVDYDLIDVQERKPTVEEVKKGAAAAGVTLPYTDSELEKKLGDDFVAISLPDGKIYIPETARDDSLRLAALLAHEIEHQAQYQNGNSTEVFIKLQQESELYSNGILDPYRTPEYLEYNAQQVEDSARGILRQQSNPEKKGK